MLLKILLVTQDLTVLRHCGTHLTGLDVALQYSSPQSLRRPLPLIQAHPFSSSRIPQWLQERAPKAWFACGVIKYNVKGEEGFQNGETVSASF